MYRERNSMDDVLIRLENSYPFDSNWDGYDDEGYPVYDRAVAALMLRKCLRQFFTTGIFGTPESNLKLTKGDGFNINIHPGVAIIDGGIGAITDDAGMDITILDGAPRGIQTCSVFIRLNDNEDARSLFVRIAHTVGDTPAEPITAPAIYELRLGYITVPSNAEDLTDALLVDERGTSVCPYAAPFMEIDIADILANVREQAGDQYEQFLQYLLANMEFIQSAIDGTMAGHLQNEMEALRDELAKATEDLQTKAVLKSKIDPDYFSIDESGDLTLNAKGVIDGLDLMPSDYVDRAFTFGGYEELTTNYFIDGGYLNPTGARLNVTASTSILTVTGSLGNGVSVNGTAPVSNPYAASFNTVKVYPVYVFEHEDSSVDIYVLYSIYFYSSSVNYNYYTIMTPMHITAEGIVTSDTAQKASITDSQFYAVTSIGMKLPLNTSYGTSVSVLSVVDSTDSSGSGRVQTYKACEMTSDGVLSVKDIGFVLNTNYYFASDESDVIEIGDYSNTANTYSVRILCKESGLEFESFSPKDFNMSYIEVMDSILTNVELYGSTNDIVVKNAIGSDGDMHFPVRRWDLTEKLTKGTTSITYLLAIGCFDSKGNFIFQESRRLGTTDMYPYFYTSQNGIEAMNKYIVADDMERVTYKRRIIKNGYLIIGPYAQTQPAQNARIYPMGRIHR